MIIDAHGHLWLGDIDNSKDAVLRLCGRYDIRKVFISTLDAASYVPDSGEIRAANRETLRFMRERPGLVEGMAYVNPRNADCLDEARRCLEEGMRGIKLWVATLCDDPLVDPVARLALQYDVPILAHTFYKATGMLPYESRAYHAAGLAERYPRLRLLVAHVGANVYDAVRCLAPYPNVFVDISGSIFRGDDLDYAVERLGAERVLFGSDMPGSFESCYGQVYGAALTAEQREDVFHRNAARFFGLEQFSKFALKEAER